MRNGLKYLPASMLQCYPDALIIGIMYGRTYIKPSYMAGCCPLIGTVGNFTGQMAHTNYLTIMRLANRYVYCHAEYIFEYKRVWEKDYAVHGSPATWETMYLSVPEYVIRMGLS